MITTLDHVAGVIDDMRTENTVGAHQIRELNLKTENHEQRINRLESPNLV